MTVNALDQFLQTGEPLHVAADGQMSFASSRPVSTARLLIPGSFNPIHRGHWELARVAEQLIGVEAAFELSVTNVDKPALAGDDIRRRLAPFNWQTSMWLTQAPRFADKADLFPGAIFVVGADTALRIMSPAYYANLEGMLASVRRIRDQGCRFLVACRVDARGKYWRLRDLPIPAGLHDLFAEIDPERFRVDLSSSELRAR